MYWNYQVPQFVGYPYSELDMQRYPNLINSANPQPQRPETGFQKGLGVANTAMMAAAPMAQILLGKQRPRPQMPSPVVSGGRGSAFQPYNPYQSQEPEQQRQSMLIRYLLGR